MESLLPSITELIGMIYNTAKPIFDGFAPLMWYLLGITVVFIVVKGFIEYVEDRFASVEEDNYEKEWHLKRNKPNLEDYEF